IALVTNPDMSFIELLREIIGQLTGTKCEERRKIDLLEKFNKILFDTIDSGKKVLIFIDEANAMSPTNLESLRLLTNMQDDQRNLFTIVLAGQLELARRLEHPKRKNLFQRIGTLCRIDKIESENLLKGYVETRLRLAGGTKSVFADDAFGFLWEYSEHGVPRLINKMCKLSLKAGETNEFAEISGEVVRQIGERFRHLAGPAIPKRKPRKRPDGDALSASMDKGTEVTGGNGDLSAEAFTERRRSHDAAETRAVEPGADRKAGADTAAQVIETGAAKKDISVEMEINGFKVAVNIPHHIAKQAQSSSHEHRMKVAGTLAAQIMKKYEELAATAADPISLWSDIREFVANQLK
ncbi:MAG TPA: AAA family ATPase, partial [Syntrophales bacterium]|nr:AAA family ATPase [Syntrophales bacterium]